jgi:polyisoprenoid-binding protein YceI
MTRLTFSTLSAALMAATLSAAVQAAPVTYALDPTHTFVTFEAKHFGTSTNRGRFDKKSGSVTIDTAAQTGQVDITLETGSINTGTAAFENHFKSTKVVFEGDKVSSVVGNLTLLGKSQTVTLKANYFGCYDNPMLKRQVCGGDFETTIQRADFGMSYGLPFIPNDIKLVIQVEAVKQ